MQGGNELEHTVLEAVAEQMMRGAEVGVEGHSFRVTRRGDSGFGQYGF
jgi:hypothetical protein